MSRAVRRPIRAGLAAATLLMGTGEATSAGYREGWEPLIFQLTLSDDVDPGDTFLITHFCADDAEHPECIWTHPVSYFCAGDDELRADWGYPICAAGVYTIEYERDAGITVDWALARTSAAGVTERLLADTISVPEGGITPRLGYAYPSAQPAGPLLPDTATPPSARSGSFTFPGP